MGKRPEVPGGRKVPHFVRVTVEEEAALQGLVVELGARNVADVLVQCALYMRQGGDSPSQRREWARELLAVRRQLAGVANNLNQLARRANVEDRVPVAELREQLAHLRVLAGPDGRIDEVLEGFAREGVAV